MSRIIRVAMLLGIFLMVLPTGVRSAGSNPLPSTPAAPPKSPEEQAADHYNWGIAHRDNAWKQEKKAAEATTENARLKLETKAQKHYKKAIAEFRSAVQKNPRLFQAYSSLGYALRKTGEPEASLTAYDRALAIEPGYSEAIEYRAETYLGLNRIEDAKKAYIQLFGRDRPQADKLLEAMRAWLDRRNLEGSGGVDPRTLEAFSRWVAEREEIAGQTTSVSELRARDW